MFFFVVQDDKHPFENKGTSATAQGTGCSANSFLIQDGVCDEITNIQRCLYDGGDCCKEDKKSHICRKCTCHIDFDEDKLLEKMEDNEVAVYASEQLDHFKVVRQVEEIASKPTCLAFCFGLIAEGAMDINTVIYYHKSGSRNCSCASFENCFNNSYWDNQAEPAGIINTKTKTTDVVGLTKKFLPCCK